MPIVGKKNTYSKLFFNALTAPINARYARLLASSFSAFMLFRSSAPMVIG